MNTPERPGISMSWPVRIALVHPVWLLVFSFAVLGVQLVFLWADPRSIFSAAVCGLFALWLFLGSIYGVYAAARQASMRRRIEIGKDRGWVFLLSAVTIIVGPAAFLELQATVDRVFQVLGYVAAFSFFMSLWLAAAALVTSEGQPVRYPTNRAAGAFLLLFYWPIGMWVLRPRLLALREGLGDDRQVRDV